MVFQKVRVFRIKPGQELLGGIADYCREHNITSAVIIGIIGSVTRARLNFIMSLPGNFESVDYTGPLEIVAAQGSVASKAGSPIIHVHVQLSGKDICRGGHLAEAIIFSTAEVVIAELDYQLHRQSDSYTGLNELA